jgi:hypothetical protein
VSHDRNRERRLTRQATPPSPKLAKKMSKPRVRRLKPRRIPQSVIDRTEFHAFLWERADEQRMVRVHMTKLAEALGCSTKTVSSVMHVFCEQGRALRVRFDKDGVGIYQIADPVTWNRAEESTWANGRKVLQWG